MDALQTVLIQIGVILLLSRALGTAMRWIGQPQVIGEMIAGIMLGPSVLGLFQHGRWMHALFPAGQMATLSVLSQLGVMLFMFLVGLELNPRQLRGQGKAAVLTGVVGIAAPFVLGVMLAVSLTMLKLAGAETARSSLVLSLFIGAAMSITAFPVLARILTERNLHKTQSGALALTAAGINDVLGWCVLAFVLAVARMKGYGDSHASHGSTDPGAAVGSAVRTVVFAAVYILAMAFGARKLLGRLQAHFNARGYLSQTVIAAIFLLLILSSLTTDLIGIHQIFGAFMVGAVMPKDQQFIKHLSEKIEDFAVLFLLPLFFAYTGTLTDIGLLSSPSLWALSSLIIFVAMIGKIGGVTAAARWCGMSWRQSGLLGVLMNTRGLMELIILNIGLSLGVLSPSLFTMFVVMALVTTFSTTPLMRLLYSPARQRKELEDAQAQEAELGVNVVVPVSLPATAGSLVRLGSMLIGKDPGRIYALHLQRPDEVESRSMTADPLSDAALEMAQQAAVQSDRPLRAISYVSRNIARDIASAAVDFRAAWVVMGWHKPVFFRSVLGPTVTHVIQYAPSNVAILVDKGLGNISRIVVPYLGEKQDRGALLAAQRLGQMPDVRVTILHVVKPDRQAADERLAIQASIDREFPSVGGENAVRLQVIESESPIEVAVAESAKYDLMILGLSETWDIRNVSMYGKHQSVAQRSHCSLLIVHASPVAPRPVPRPSKAPPPEASTTAGTAELVNEAATG